MGMMMIREHWITGAFLVLLIVAAFTAHAGAITISSKDNVSIATKEAKDATTWVSMEQGDIASVSFTAHQTVKILLSLGKEKVEPIVQINPGADLVVSANYAGGDADIVQVGKERIEGYYSYGKSSTYPWGIYWAINDIGGKPMLVYAEFSKRSTYYIPISYDSVAELKGQIEKGEIPSLVTVQKVVGI